LFLKEGAILLREFGPFPKENSLLLGEVVFSPGNYFYTMGNLLGTNI
jgi:hypothetical protein